MFLLENKQTKKKSNYLELSNQRRITFLTTGRHWILFAMKHSHFNSQLAAQRTKKKIPLS